MTHLGDIFPNFECETAFVDNFNFYNYIGNKWCIFFSHPYDFTPVCTTELAEFEKRRNEFESLNCLLIGLSCNNKESHIKWIEDIKKYGGLKDWKIPLICDESRELATKLKILDEKEKDSNNIPLTCRSVFFIGPDKKVKSLILYPATTGRNVDEVLRVLKSLQLTDKCKVATPVNWTVGDKCCIVPNLSNEEAKKIFNKFETIQLPSKKEYLRFTEIKEL